MLHLDKTREVCQNNTMTERFTPPIFDTKVIGVNVDPDENTINSISLAITDANHKLFTLHVETEKNYGQQIIESYNERSFDDYDTLEPVFMIPTKSLDIDNVKKTMSGVDPELLALYLVPQTTYDHQNKKNFNNI